MTLATYNCITTILTMEYIDVVNWKLELCEIVKVVVNEL